MYYFSNKELTSKLPVREAWFFAKLCYNEDSYSKDSGGGQKLVFSERKPFYSKILLVFWRLGPFLPEKSPLLLIMLPRNYS